MRTRFPAIAVTALLSLTVVSCDSFLQTEPPLDISNDVALSTPAGIEAVMVGAADAMQSGALFGGNVMSMGELWSDNVESNVGADFGRLQILTYNLNIFNPEGRSMWGDGYGVINRVNNVLAALDNVPFDNPARAQQLRGHS